MNDIIVSTGSTSYTISERSSAGPNTIPGMARVREVGLDRLSVP